MKFPVLLQRSRYANLQILRRLFMASPEGQNGCQVVLPNRFLTVARPTGRRLWQMPSVLL
jgi:hypothetical protein